MLVVTVILVFFINETTSRVMDNRPNQRTVELKLHKDLLTDYLAYQPPSTNVTTVHLRFILQYFYFGKTLERFYIYTWTILIWKDPRLVWKAEDYEDINKTQMNALLIWRPLASFTNINDLNDGSELVTKSSNSCKLKSDGRVLCALRQYHATNCKIKLNNWPYDIQFCSFKFISDSSGPLRHPHHRVRYSLTVKNSTAALSYGSGWNIVDTNSGVIEANDTTIQFDFLVERQALGFATIVVIPSIVMAIFTLSSMFLDVRSNVRIVVVSLSLLNHFAILEIISVFIPHHDFDTPLILRFICASIFTTTCSIVLSITLNLLLAKKTSSLTTKVVVFNERILKSRFKSFIFPNWEAISNEESGDSSNIAEIWANFASIVNSLFLYTLLVIYFILYCVFIPRPTKIS